MRAIRRGLLPFGVLFLAFNDLGVVALSECHTHQQFKEMQALYFLLFFFLFLQSILQVNHQCQFLLNQIDGLDASEITLG